MPTCKSFWDLFGHKSLQKMVFGDFHDHGVEVWVQGAFGTVFWVAQSPGFDFFRSAGDPGARRAVAGHQRGDADKPPTVPGEVNSRLDTNPATLPLRVRTIFWLNHVHYCCLSPGISILSEVFWCVLALPFWAPVTASGAPRSPTDPKKSKPGLRATQKTVPKAPWSLTSTRGRESCQKPFFGWICGQKGPKMACIWAFRQKKNIFF